MEELSDRDHVLVATERKLYKVDNNRIDDEGIIHDSFVFPHS